MKTGKMKLLFSLAAYSNINVLNLFDKTNTKPQKSLTFLFKPIVLVRVELSCYLSVGLYIIMLKQQI